MNFLCNRDLVGYINIVDGKSPIFALSKTIEVLQYKGVKFPFIKVGIFSKFVISRCSDDGE